MRYQVEKPLPLYQNSEIIVRFERNYCILTIFRMINIAQQNIKLLRQEEFLVEARGWARGI